MGSLILDTQLKGDSATVRATADWLGRLIGAEHEAVTACNNVRAHSLAVWDGPAGDIMRHDLSETTQGGDTLVDRSEEYRRGLLTFADRLDTVRGKLNDARGKATAVGLKVTPGEIYPPAPAPPGPPMDSGRSPQSPADAQQMAIEHDAAMNQYKADLDRENKQAPVYSECRDLVADARELERTAHEDLDKLSTGIDGWVKNLKKIGFMALSGGLDAIKGSQEAVTDLTRLSVELSDSAEVFNKIANGKYLTDNDKTILSAWEADTNAKAGTMAARADGIGKWMSKIPEGAREAIVLNPGSLIGESANVFAKGGKVVLKGLPLVGTLVTVGSASVDVAMGEDLGKVAVSTIAETGGQIAGGWAGGALVGAAMGSEVPVAGTVVGAVVGGIIGGMAANQVVESSYGDG
jgi:hypothetical protein